MTIVSVAHELEFDLSNIKVTHRYSDRDHEKERRSLDIEMASRIKSTMID